VHVEGQIERVVKICMKMNKMKMIYNMCNYRLVRQLSKARLAYAVKDLENKI
jgi:DNA replicative helicase MCM subunit Mcm2 (Cdc46/Mcm family)